MSDPTYGGLWTPEDPMLPTASTEDSSGWDELVDKIKGIIRLPPLPPEPYY